MRDVGAVTAARGHGRPAMGRLGRRAVCTVRVVTLHHLPHNGRVGSGLVTP